MDTAYLVAFSIVAGALFLLFSVVALVFWARLSGVEQLNDQRFMEVAEKAEPKEVSRALTVAETSAARVDAAALGLEKFKEQIHREMQRFYAIMRRTENSATLAAAAQKPEEEIPTEISPEDLKQPTADASDARKSKAELREIARQKGISI